MTPMLLKVVIGALVGAALGYFGRCATGSCPLTANWRRGAAYGAFLGLLFHVAAGGGAGTFQPPKNVRTVSEADFDAVVAQAGKPVVVDFFATWCGPCRRLMPRVDALAAEMGDRVVFVAVDIDQSPGLAQRFQVEGVPTLVYLAPGGQVADRTVGLLSETALRERVALLAARSVRAP